jgi:predicted acetyltransferase
MTDPYPVRPVTPDEFDAYALVTQHAFNESPIPDSDRSRVMSYFEWDRTLAAFDPDLGRPAGITLIYSFQLTVPGASLPAAGVTWVAVLPSHRRRGILTSLMRRQLSDVAARGEPLAILWASEAGIYGRYGYGRASWHLTFDVRRGEGALAPAIPAGLRTRLIPPADARPELAKVYDLVLQSRPGFFARDTAWWDRRLHDPESRRNGASPLRCLLAEDDQGTRGYALYSGTERWDDSTFLADSTLNVRELIAADPAASATLWNDLLSRDLVTSFRAGLRPADDPLLYQLAAYLGGTRLSAPAGAGLVTEHRPGAIRELSTAMSWDPAPWCPIIF